MEILTAKWIFDGSKLIQDKAVVMKHNIVLDVENVRVAKKTYNDFKLKDFGEGVVFPGFVNAHTHLELSYLKTEPYLGFIDWLKNIISKKQETVEYEKIESAINLAILQLKRSGVCAIADISNTLRLNYLEHFKEKVIFFENYSLKKAIALEKIFYLKNNLKNIQNKHPKVYASPHSIYSTHKLLLKYTMLKNKSFIGNDLFSIHFLESSYENQFAQSKGKLFDLLYDMGLVEERLNYKSALDYIKHLGKLKEGLFVHCVFIEKKEIDYLKENKASIVICPRSNYYIEQRLPDLDMLLASNINIAIGTDSLASNWDLDFINELRFLYKNFSHISPQVIFKMACDGGSKALKLDIGFKKASKAYPFFMKSKLSSPLDEILQ